MSFGFDGNYDELSMMTAERRAAWLKQSESRRQCATTANEYTPKMYISF